jgi:FdhE protein
MAFVDYDIEELKRQIDLACAQHPHAANLLAAFAPLIIATTRWAQEAQCPEIPIAFDPLQHLAGKPLLEHCRLFAPSDPWTEAAEVAAKAIGEGFPHFAKEIQDVAEQITRGGLDCCSILKTWPRAADSAPGGTREQEMRLPETPAFTLFIRLVRRLILTARARRLEYDFSSWKKGYCPVCGSFPMLAILRDKGQRWLQCPECAYEWRFSRLACPYCDHQDPAETESLYIEGEKDSMTFLCSKCDRYLLTAGRSDELYRQHPAVIAICLAHLDVIMQERGFVPLSACEWDTFPDRRKGL